MAKAKFTLSIGYPTARHEEVVEIDDDTTDEQLQKDWEQWMWNYIDGGPERLEG